MGGRLAGNQASRSVLIAIQGGISAVLALSAAVGVGYDVGYPGGAMFIDYPEDFGDVALIDELIDEAYEARTD